MSNNKTNSIEFVRNKEALMDWPYTTHSIEESLDVDLIEGRARQLLYQAVNKRTLVAFAGSGLSMAYGRLSWTNWLSRQLGTIQNFAVAYEDVCISALALIEKLCSIDFCEKPLEGLHIEDKAKVTLIEFFLRERKLEIGYRYDEFKELFTAFKSLQEGRFHEKEHAICFEVASKLQDLLLRDVELFFDPSFDPIQTTNSDIETDREKNIAVLCEENGWGYNPSCRHAHEPTFLYEGRSLFREEEKETPSNGRVRGRPAAVDEIIWDKFQNKLKNFILTATRGDARMSVKEMAKYLLVDECAHAEDMLMEATLFQHQTGREPWREYVNKDTNAEKVVNNNIIRVNRITGKSLDLRRDIQGIRDKHKHYWSLGFYKRRSLRDLVNHLNESEADTWQITKDRWSNVLMFALELVGDIEQRSYGARSDIERVFLSPTHRFVVPMLLTLLEDPYEQVGGWPQESADLWNENRSADDNSILHPIRPQDYKARESLMSPDLDPVAKLFHQLNIEQFLTTNFDFEIERYFQDRGFRSFPGTSQMTKPEFVPRHSFRIDGIGGVLKDLDFQRETSAELLDFTIHKTNADASVFHLHGRATEDGNPVVSERDYMIQYLRHDEHRETVEESLSVAFSANPILFVGLGMNEADVLRPLRQFMSSKDETLGRTAIVLSPVSTDKHQLAQEAALRFVRYGTHTIHYGKAWLPKNESEWEQRPWLGHIEKVLKTMLRRITIILGALNENADDNVKAAAKMEAKKCRCDIWKELPGESINALLQRGRLEKVDLKDFDAVENTISLIPAVFTREMPEWSAANQIEFQKAVESHLHLEIRLIPLLLKVYLKSPEALQGANLNDLSDPGSLVSIRELRATKVGVEGLLSSVQTAVLCLALEDLDNGHRIWWEHWRTPPPARKAEFGQLPTASCDKFCEPLTENGRPIKIRQRFVRHQVKNIITDPSPATITNLPYWQISNQPEQEIRFRNFGLFPDVDSNAEENEKEITGIRSYDNFLRALRSRIAAQTQPETHGESVGYGRRLHYVATHRGVGKGSFMAAMMSQLGLSWYIKCLWSGVRLRDQTDYYSQNSKPIEPEYTHSFFINISFSTEIASIFDMIINALSDLNGVETTLAADLSRLNRFRKVLWDFKAISRERSKEQLKDHNFESIEQPRILFCFSGTELLHDRFGVSKTREIEEIFSLLTSGEVAEFPIDVVLLGDERNIGEYLVADSEFERRFTQAVDDHKSEFSKGDYTSRLLIESKLHFVQNVRPEIRAKEKQSLSHRKKMSKIVFPEDSNPDATAIRVIDDTLEQNPVLRKKLDQTCMVHYARTMKPEQLLVDNFRPLAFIFFAGFIRDCLRKSFDTSMQRNNISESEIREKMLSIGKTIEEVYLLDNLMVGAVEHDRIWLEKPDQPEMDSAIIWRNKLKQRNILCDIEIIKLAKWAHNADGDKGDQDNNPFSKQLKHLYDVAVSIGDPAHGLLLERYELEKMCGPSLDRSFAASKEWRRVRNTLRGHRYCLTILLAAAQYLALRGRNIMHGRLLAETFIRDTLDEVEAVSLNRREEVTLSKVLDVYEIGAELGKPSKDNDLHLLILRYLAVIGTATSVDVLIQTPEIRDHFEKLEEAHERSFRFQLFEALTVLANRGLIFELASHPWRQSLYDASASDQKASLHGGESNGHAPRFALHRTMQRHVLRKIGAPLQEFAQTNEFSPSVYVSMPSELPRLNAEGLSFLQRLVLRLSQYPDHQGQMPGHQNWVLANQPHSTQVQALRAAGCCIRSIMSVAVVSRFDDIEPSQTEGISKSVGHFEQYRLQVRWLIRKAYQIVTAQMGNPLPDSSKLLCAFYRGEIVWLYNECGLINLVQGNLSDAFVLLEQAIAENRKIEGQYNGGAMHNRMSLNLAIVQIERGRLEAAKTRLQAICLSESNDGTRPGRLWHLAYGYLGLIEHFYGDLEKAKKRYQAATKVLRLFEDTRACAVFYRHWGDLERRRGHFTEADDHLNTAQSFAESGGHQDILMRTRLSKATLEVHKCETDGRLNELHGFEAELAAIGRYADRMGMFSLRVDARLIRAKINLLEGNTSSAGRLMAENISVAKRYGMDMRLNISLSNYGEILAKRGKVEEARMILATSLDMAKKAGNQLQIDLAESILRAIETGEL